MHLLFLRVLQRLPVRAQQYLSYQVSVRCRRDGFCEILVRVLGAALRRVALEMVNVMAFAVVVSGVVL